MPQPRPLSRSRIPVPGESLPGFLLRLSYRLSLPPARLAELAGLRSGGVRGSRLPPVLVAGIPAPALPAFTRMTRLTDGQAGELGLATWQGRYPVPAAGTATGYRRLDSRLVFAPAPRFSPECLARDGSAAQESFGGPPPTPSHPPPPLPSPPPAPAGPLLPRPPPPRAAGLLNMAGGPAPGPFRGNSVRR